jgi:hypothetical protein
MCIGKMFVKYMRQERKAKRFHVKENQTNSKEGRKKWEGGKDKKMVANTH